MNDYTPLVTVSTPDYIKQEIDKVLTELKKHHYAYIYDSATARHLAKQAMELRQAGLLIFCKPCGAECLLKTKYPEYTTLKNIITLPHNCELSVQGLKIKVELKMQGDNSFE